MSDTASLRELHDTYVWEVNAAIGEGRMDLVWRLADEYTEKALELITADAPRCERPDCPVCARSASSLNLPVRRGWLRWARRRHAA